ncbi:hypothetical protein ABPG75_012872 [Micractinium tetrahymenae]
MSLQLVGRNLGRPAEAAAAALAGRCLTSQGLHTSAAASKARLEWRGKEVATLWGGGRRSCVGSQATFADCHQAPCEVVHFPTTTLQLEKGPQQTDSAEGVKQPFEEGDTLAARREIKDSYRDVLKDRSGTAEDVGVLDEKQSSLGRMMAEPRAVEQDRADAAHETVAAHGGRERESEDDSVAEAVFDQTRSDPGYDPTPANKPGTGWDATFATKPK